MKHLTIISHYSFRAIGFHKSRSPSSIYSPAPQGIQLITLIGIGIAITYPAKMRSLCRAVGWVGMVEEATHLSLSVYKSGGEGSVRQWDMAAPLLLLVLLRWGGRGLIEGYISLKHLHKGLTIFGMKTVDLKNINF